MTKPERLPYQTILAVNSTQKDELELALLQNGKKTLTKKSLSRAQDLQQLIENFLTENKLAPKDLKAIAVYRIADSLTGTRMGLAAVNTISWLYDLPIIVLDGETFADGIKSIEQSSKNLSVVRQAKPLS